MSDCSSLTIFDRYGDLGTRHYEVNTDNPMGLFEAMEKYCITELHSTQKIISIDYEDRDTEFSPLFDFGIALDGPSNIQYISGLYSLKIHDSIGEESDRLYMVVFSPYSREDMFNVMGNMGK